METMYEEKLEQLLQGLLQEAELDPYAEEDEGVGVEQVRTYADAGILTRNKGLVLTMTDGTEFQLQIVQSK